jgi:hypothetical protein
MEFFERFLSKKEKQPEVLDSHDQVDPAAELEAINQRLSELNLAEDTEDTRDEIRRLRTKKENLENPVTDWGQK